MFRCLFCQIWFGFWPRQIKGGTNCASAQEPVAGPGSVLFFRYQLFIMVWALVIAGLWAFRLQYVRQYVQQIQQSVYIYQFFCFYTEVAFVSTTDGSLYALGTEDPQSPRELCAVIHRGYVLQRTAMSTKANFLAVAYVTSFVLCIGFGILQKRAFHSWSLTCCLQSSSATFCLQR